MRGKLRRVPAAAWVCALIALLNATAWSIIIPPFQGRDEVDHFAYVAQLADGNAAGKRPREGGRTPRSRPWWWKGSTTTRCGSRRSPPSPQWPSSRRSQDVHGAPRSWAPEKRGWPVRATAVLRAADGSLPPGGGNMLIQLAADAAVGALLAAITALLCFLFLREVLPACRGRPPSGRCASRCNRCSGSCPAA